MKRVDSELESSYKLLFHRFLVVPALFIAFSIMAYPEFGVPVFFSWAFLVITFIISFYILGIIMPLNWLDIESLRVHGWWGSQVDVRLNVRFLNYLLFSFYFFFLLISIREPWLAGILFITIFLLHLLFFFGSVTSKHTIDHWSILDEMTIKKCVGKALPNQAIDWVEEREGINPRISIARFRIRHNIGFKMRMPGEEKNDHIQMSLGLITEETQREIYHLANRIDRELRKERRKAESVMSRRKIFGENAMLHVYPSIVYMFIFWIIVVATLTPFSGSFALGLAIIAPGICLLAFVAEVSFISKIIRDYYRPFFLDLIKIGIFVIALGITVSIFVSLFVG